MIEYNLLRLVCKSHVVFIWFSFLTCSAITWELSHESLWRRIDVLLLIINKRGFSGSSVVKDLPASAGNLGLIPDPGGSHMPQNDKACVPQLLTLYSKARVSYWAHVPQLLKAMWPRACAPQEEKPSKKKTCTPQLKSGPHFLNVDKSPHSNKDPAQPEINK